MHVRQKAQGWRFPPLRAPVKHRMDALMHPQGWYADSAASRRRTPSLWRTTSESAKIPLHGLSPNLTSGLRLWRIEAAQMKRTIVRLLTLILLLGSLPCMAQQPYIFDVSTVVVGSQRLETLWAYALGKWSDAGDHVRTDSTEIHCYKRFGFCEVASASNSDGLASVSLESFDILRWDTSEMIAVDSSPICLVNTLRFDFAAKKVSNSSTSKGETRDWVCRELTPSTMPTAFLAGATGETGQKKK